jgi:hypothetical protein
MSERLPHDLNCLTISELQKHAAVMMDKQTRDYYNEVSVQHQKGLADTGNSFNGRVPILAVHSRRTWTLTPNIVFDPEFCGMYQKSIPA